MEQKLCYVALIVLMSIALLSRCINADGHSDAASEGTDNAALYQKTMYNFLRNMALPPGDPTEDIDQRFILQVSIQRYSGNCLVITSNSHLKLHVAVL